MGDHGTQSWESVRYEIRTQYCIRIVRLQHLFVAAFFSTGGEKLAKNDSGIYSLCSYNGHHDCNRDSSDRQV